MSNENLITDYRELYSSPRLQVSALIFDRSAPICVEFAPMNLPREASMLRMAKRLRINCIAVGGAGYDWFQYPDLPEALDRIQEVTREFPRVLLYGASMGGYGALITSGALRPDTILVCAPQAVVGEGRPPEDQRYTEAWGRVSAEYGFIHDDIAGRLDREAQLIVVIDPRNPTDMAHMRVIEALRPVQQLTVPFVGHAVLQFLVRIGLGSRLVREVMQPDFDVAAFQSEIHRRRKPGAQLQRLIYVATRRRRPVPLWMIRRFLDDPKDTQRKQRLREAEHALAEGRFHDLHFLARTLLDEQPIVDRVCLRAMMLQCVRDGHAPEGLALFDLLLQEPTYFAQATLMADLDAAVPLMRAEGNIETWAAAFQAKARAVSHVGPSLALLLASAVLLHHAGLRERAVSAACEAALMVAVASPAMEELGRVFEILGEPGRAAHYRSQKPAIELEGFVAAFGEATRAEREGDWNRAAEIWAEALQAGLEPLRVAPRLAKALFKLERFEDVIKALKPLHERKAIAQGEWRLQGDAEMRLERHEDAAESFRQALALSPLDPRLHRSYATALVKLDRHAEALPHAEQAMKAAPGNVGNQRFYESVRAKVSADATG
ncbi:tetratricopeptide repeat protein [Roseococcus sp. YIM B11640]|uniref:tetratricopeptide repeat protein n=1 Tax=Roseococcus sp. YIM B11640 TaxID=3133973 RepID=UPI003C7C1B44